MTFLLFVALLFQAVKTQPPRPATDPNGPNVDAKPATIRGKVSAADTGAPLKGAQVMLQGTAGSRETFSVATNADGTDEIANIPVDSGSPVPKMYFVHAS